MHHVCVHLFLCIHFYLYLCLEFISISLIGVAVWDDPTSAYRAFSGKGLYPVVEEKERDQLSEDTSTPIWRLGEHHSAKQLLLRLATTLDVKKQGSANRSKYYRKYGNPNLPSYQVNKGQRRKDLRYLFT